MRRLCRLCIAGRQVGAGSKEIKTRSHVLWLLNKEFITCVWRILQKPHQILCLYCNCLLLENKVTHGILVSAGSWIKIATCLKLQWCCSWICSRLSATVLSFILWYLKSIDLNFSKIMAGGSCSVLKHSFHKFWLYSIKFTIRSRS